MTKKGTIYLAVVFAAGPCFAAPSSFEQLENSAGVSAQEMKAGVLSADLNPVAAPAVSAANDSGYAAAVSAFNAYRDSKRNGIKNDDNLPFFLDHGARTRNTVVMIHGLTDSPWFMRSLGEVLYQQGYNVIALLLPGHGTKPEDLFTVTKEQWQQEVDRGLAIAAGLGEHISLAGFSTGGTLALDALRRHPELKAEKLFLFSPALAINESNQTEVSLGCKAPWLATHLLGQYTGSADAVENDPHRYNKMALNGVCQLYYLTNDIQNGQAKQVLDSLRSGTGVFAVESEADKTVSPAAVTKFMASLPDQARDVYVLYPLADNIAHADVTRPETNPMFPELSSKLQAYTAGSSL
jgi:esterase/lipase